MTVYSDARFMMYGPYDVGLNRWADYRSESSDLHNSTHERVLIVFCRL